MRYRKRIKDQQARLPSVIVITKKTCRFVWQERVLFAKLLALYVFLTLVLVRGFAADSSISDTKALLADGEGAKLTTLETGTVLLSSVTGTGTGSESGAVYQTILTIVFAIVVIWLARKRFANDVVTIKQAFYNGLYPIVPFMVVLLIIGLQLIPFSVGSWLYSTTAASGIVVGNVERAFWVSIFLALTSWSLYLLSSSLFALYAVCLPNMTPLRALRSVRSLVVHRRVAVMLRLVFLPILVLIVGACIMLPTVLFVPAIADLVFMVCSLAAWVFSVVYGYILYRELLV